MKRERMTILFFKIIISAVCFIVATLFFSTAFAREGMMNTIPVRAELLIYLSSVSL